MASFDGFLVPITQPSFSDAFSSDAPIVDGFLVPTQAFSSSAQAFFLPDVGGGITFRMRAIDTTLARTVYWDSTAIDDTGTDYTGPGPLIDIVISEVIGS